MKRTTFLHTTTLIVLAFFALAASQAWAAIRLSQPSGVAVDSQGNIYVANSATNQILVYDVNRVQQSNKTISAGLAHPSGLAFDSNGNLWVANYGQTGYDSSVTEYNPKGQQVTGATITANLQFTLGIAVDSMNNVWASNNYSTVTQYSPFGTYLGSSTPGFNIWSIATRGKWYVVASSNEWVAYSTGEVLRNAVTSYLPDQTQGRVGAVGFDSMGNFYVYQSTGEVDYVNPNSEEASVFTEMGSDFQVTGIAVDNAHSRVYLSSYNNSQVYVYTTAGVYVGLIG
jgi:streptogramin lyase